MQHKPARTPTIFVTGRNGQVGFELIRSLSTLGHVMAPDRAGCDLTDADAIRAMVGSLRPDVIVNAAACTAVDDAEANPALAFAVNGKAPGVLAEEARALGSLLVHYSTDYVFAGSGDIPHRETDDVGPLSVYGKSKLAGERAIAETCADAIVLRTSWVAGAHGSNFVKTVLKLARERTSLQVVNDQFGAPTTAALIADVTARLVDRWLYGRREECPCGLYHLAAAGETSWHGYAAEVLRYAASQGVALQAGPEAIEAIPSAAWPQRAPRPANSRLDTGKFREAFNMHLPDWQHGVHHLIEQIVS